MRTRTQRDQIEQFLKSIDTTDLDGGVLPRDLFDEWFEEMQETADLLGQVRTVAMPRESMRIPKIGVGERLRRGQDEGESNTEEDVETDFVDLDAQKGSLYWSMTSEAQEDTVADTANVVFNQMNQQFAVDTQDLGINGDEGSADEFLQDNDGWLAVAEDRAMPEYDHQEAGEDQPIDDDVFHETLQTIEQKYLRPVNGQEPRFYMARQQVQEYAHSLIERESPLGDSVLFGQVDLAPFSYELVGIPTWPMDQALFTNPQNLVYGLYRDVEIDALTESDKIFEEDLAGRWAIRTRDDFQIEDEDAGVLVTGLEDPTAE